MSNFFLVNAFRSTWAREFLKGHNLFVEFKFQISNHYVCCVSVCKGIHLRICCVFFAKFFSEGAKMNYKHMINSAKESTTAKEIKLKTVRFIRNISGMTTGHFVRNIINFYNDFLATTERIADKHCDQLAVKIK